MSNDLSRYQRVDRSRGGAWAGIWSIVWIGSLLSLIFAARLAAFDGPEESAPGSTVVKLTVAEAQNGDQVGGSVAVDGSRIVAGAFRTEAGRGVAYLWEQDPAGGQPWRLAARLIPDERQEREWFGYSVAVSGDTVAVGAYGSQSGAGAVYLFERDSGAGDRWVLIKKIMASDGEADDRFGSSLAFSGNTLLVGAPGKKANQGGAYLFERNQGGIREWGEVVKLIPREAATGGRFGIAVALEGDTAVVGMDWVEDFRGEAIVFERHAGGKNQWGQVQPLSHGGLNPFDFFGSAVAVYGNTILVGACGDDEQGQNAGAAYVFIRENHPENPWRPVQKLMVVDGAAEEQFGSAVAIHADRLLIGAPWNAERGEYAGAVYVFELVDGTNPSWRMARKLTAYDGQERDRFGRAVASSGDAVAAGTYHDDDRSGAVYLFPNTNGPLFIVGSEPYVIMEDSFAHPIPFSVISPSGAVPTVRAVSHDPALIPSANLFLTYQGNSQWELSVTPAPDQHGGPVTVTLEAEDGQGGTSRAVLRILIDDINDPPVITEEDPVVVTMNRNGFPVEFALTLHTVDADGDELTWEILTSALHGMARAHGTGNAAEVRYTPVYNYVGQDSFTVLVSDGRGGIDTRIIQVTIRPGDGESGEGTTSMTPTPDGDSPTPTGAPNDNGSASPTPVRGEDGPTSTPTPAPVTPSPTLTPAPSATPPPVSVSIPEGMVEVFDDALSVDPLTGKTGFDSLLDRQLVIRWNYPGDFPVTDWHIYVRKGEGGYFYIGRTGDGASRWYTWNTPDFNAQYQFQVWGLYRNEQNQNRTVVLSQAGPMGYNLAGGKPVALQKISNPGDLAPGTAIVVDDLYHNRDLSGGSDSDPLLERALALKWNPGEGEFINAHVQVSTNGIDYQFLGQTGANDLWYFRFDANGTFAQAGPWLSGPQDETAYWFRIVAFQSDGGFVPMNTGPVLFQVEKSSAIPTPGAVEVYDDEHGTLPLTGRTDFDGLNERKLTIRWEYGEDLPIFDWHVYVRKGSGGYFFLGRAGTGTMRQLNWMNPEINAQYQFRIWGLYKNAMGQDQPIVLSQAGPMGYTLENSRAVSLKKISNPDDLPPGQAIVVDDLLHGADLSGGVDVDPPLEKALALKWNPGAGKFVNTHLFASTDGGNYTYLGQTGADDIQYFRFDANGTFPLEGGWKNGPQDQVTYWFRITALREGGGVVTLDTGPVRFAVQE
ncbi:MAG: cadherin-like domain-containing protein [Candidatus Omnitrophica bacterium]|nr:cadherin-like domain-containing protein [Candidatus Omnitrophota bacterium]